MYKVALISLLLVLSLPFLAQTSPTWFGHYGGTGNEEGQASCFDDAGNYYLAGNFKGSFSVGTTTLTSNSHEALYVIKFSPDGTLLWAVKNDTSASTQRTVVVAEMIADSQQNIYLTGSFKNSIKLGSTTYYSQGEDDIFITCVDASGAFSWGRTLGGTGTDKATGICSGTDGQPVIVGYYSTAITLGDETIPCEGITDLLVARYDSSGALDYLNHWGGVSSDESWSIASLSSGGYVLAGFYTTSITFASQVLNAGGKEAFICKLGDDLNPVWAMGTSGSGNQEGTAIAVNETSIVCIGKCNANFSLGTANLSVAGSSLFYAKLDLAGNIQLLSALGSCTSASTIVRRTVVNASGQLYGVGALSGAISNGDSTWTANGSMDALFIKVNADGSIAWLQNWGGIGLIQAASIASGSGAKYLLCGYFSNSASFGAEPVSSVGGKDIFGYLCNEASGELPAAPLNVSLQKVGTQLLLSWDEVTQAENGEPLEVDGYDIFYSSQPEDQDFQWLAQSSTCSYVIAGDELIPDIRFYRVCAYCNP